MARRRSIRRVPSEAMQDEGSWVDVSEIEWEEWKAIKKLQREFAGTPEADQASEDLDDRLLRDHVIAWNWADKDDNPLPQPGEGGLVGLLLKEKGWLIEAIFTEEEDLKN